MSDPRVPALAIVQIAVCSSFNEPDYLYALCNDGTLWRLAVKHGYEWFQLPGAPAAIDPLTIPI